MTTGVFRKIEDMQVALRHLRDAGFDKSQVGCLLMKDAAQPTGSGPLLSVAARTSSRPAIVESLVRGLMDTGLTGSQAKLFAQELKDGGALVGVRALTREGASLARRILEDTREPSVVTTANSSDHVAPNRADREKLRLLPGGQPEALDSTLLGR